MFGPAKFLIRTSCAGSCSLATALLLCCQLLWAQNAELSGLIQDPSAAVVAGAEIATRNEQTGGRRVTRSNEAGIYSLPSLSPGQYRITVRAPGFETLLQQGIILEVGQNARLDFALLVGDARTVVTVEDGPPLISAEDGSVGTVIDRKLIEKLPLNGRGIQSLIELVPAVAVVPISAHNAGGQFAINGQQSDANYFTLDGVSVNFSARAISNTGRGGANYGGQIGTGSLPALSQFGTFSNLVSADALQELRIQTSSFAPEFGRSPGGQIALATRSGTNRYTGSLFEYLRNEATDANDWFNNYSGLPKPALRFHDLGGSLGGPVDIPHLYRGFNRTFFFFSLEDVLLNQPRGAQQALVPTQEARDTVPANAAALLSATPLPNLSAPATVTDPGWGLFVGTGWLRQSQQTYGLRVDHYYSDKTILFARYNQSPSLSRDRPFNNLANTENYRVSTQTLTFGLTQIVSPKMVYELRLNGSRQAVTVNHDVDSYGGAKRPPDSLLFPAGYSGQDSNATVISKNLFFSTGLMSDTQARQLQWVQSLALNEGTHRFKFGSDFNWFSPADAPPRFSSTVILPGALYTPDPPYTDLTALVFGSRSQSNVAYSIPSFTAYAQDMWRSGRRWTATFGLRWNLNPAPGLRSGQASLLNQLTDVRDVLHLSRLEPGHRLYPTEYLHIAPRFGLAWQLFEGPARHTVLRAGAGLFYGRAQDGFTRADAEQGTKLSYTPFGATPAQSNVVSAGSSDASGVAAAPSYTMPRVYQWNITTEQALGPQTISVAYAGAVGRHLIGSLQLIAPAPYNQIDILGSRFSSSYNSLQLRFDRRLARRVQTLFAYTWSHSIDNLSDDVRSTGLSAFANPNINRGSSDFDIRQTLNGAVLVDLPAPRGGLGSMFFRNWSANAIIMSRSAPPTDVAASAVDGSFDVTVRPDVVPGQPFYLYGSGYPGGKRLNPDALRSPPAGAVQGDLGRNILRAFGAWQVDLALQRRIRLSGRFDLQVRAEAFNAFNHPNFGSITYTPNLPQAAFLFQNPALFGFANSSFGKILGTQNILGQLNPVFQIGQARSIQFSVRLKF